MFLIEFCGIPTESTHTNNLIRIGYSIPNQLPPTRFKALQPLQAAELSHSNSRVGECDRDQPLLCLWLHPWLYFNTTFNI